MKRAVRRDNKRHFTVLSDLNPLGWIFFLLPALEHLKSQNKKKRKRKKKTLNNYSITRAPARFFFFMPANKCLAGQNRETHKKTLGGCRGAGKAKSEDLWRECPSSFWGGGETEAEREGMETWSELCNSAAASVMSAAASPTGGDAPLNGGS